jgi:hypothetical protein
MTEGGMLAGVSHGSLSSAPYGRYEGKYDEEHEYHGSDGTNRKV